MKKTRKDCGVRAANIVPSVFPTRLRRGVENTAHEIERLFAKVALSSKRAL
jgi:hypothetical protein